MPPKRPDRRQPPPEPRRFARAARDCGSANLGMRQGRGAQPRGFCTRIRAVAGQICWHFCGKTWMAAAQRHGRSEFGRIFVAHSLPEISQISEARSRLKIPQKLPRFVLSLTWDFRNFERNSTRSSEDNSAYYSSVSQSFFGAVAAFYSEDS